METGSRNDKKVRFSGSRKGTFLLSKNFLLHLENFYI